jgi:hypothetical protein
MKQLLIKFVLLILALLVSAIVSASAFASPAIIIQNGDPAGVGFNDPTPATPVGSVPQMTG